MTTKTTTIKSPIQDKKYGLKTSNIKTLITSPTQKTIEKSPKPFLSPSGGELHKKFSMPQMSPRVEALLNNGVVTTRNAPQKLTSYHTSSASLTNKEQYELREQNTNTMLSPSRVYSSPRGEEKGKIAEKFKVGQYGSYSPSKINSTGYSKTQKERNCARL